MSLFIIEVTLQNIVNYYLARNNNLSWLLYRYDLSKDCELEQVKYRIFRDKLLICVIISFPFSSCSKIVEFPNSRSPFKRGLSYSLHPDFESKLDNHFSNLDFESKFSVLDLWLRLLPNLYVMLLNRKQSVYLETGS